MNSGATAVLSIILTLLLIVAGTLVGLFWDDITGKAQQVIDDHKQVEQEPDQDSDTETETDTALALVYDMPIYA